MKETPIEVITYGAGLMRITLHPRLVQSRVALVAREIMEPLTNQKFSIMIWNPSENSIHIPKRMLVALGVEALAQIVKIAREPHLTADQSGEPVDAVPYYKEKEDTATKFDRHHLEITEEVDHMQSH